MKTDNELLIGYLLGSLPGDEVDLVEAKYFADDGFYLLLEGVEEELIRDYLRGNLSGDDRRSFERKYLSNPALRERVEFSAGVMQATAPRKRQTTGRFERWFAWRGGGSLRLAMATVTVAIGIVAWQELRIQQIASRLNASGLNKDADNPQQVALSFVLSPGMTRSEQTRTAILRVPPDAGEIAIQLELGAEGKATAYRVKVETPELIQVWSSLVRESAAGEKAVRITIPASVLRAGDYIVTVDSAVEGLMHETYTFRVLRE